MVGRLPVTVAVVVALLTGCLLAPQTVDAQQGLPDLVILDIWQNGATISYRIKNAGEASLGSPNLPPSFYNALFIDGKLAAEDHFTVVLAPGQQVERSFTYQWQVTPPQDTVRVYADYRQQVAEGNEQNNSLEETWAAQLPDLIVDRIECGPGNKLLVTIKNSGVAALPAGWLAVADVYFDGVKKGSFGLNSPTSTTGGGIASPGGSSTYLLAWDILTAVTVRVVADATNGIPESDEQNNSLTQVLTPQTAAPPPTTTPPPPTTSQAPPTTQTSQAPPPTKPPPTHAPSLTTPPPTSTAPPTSQLPPPTTKTAAPPATSKPPPASETPVAAQPAVIRLISGPRVSDVTLSSAVVSWTTNLPGDSAVSYDTHAGKYRRAVSAASLVTEHRLVLTGLEAGLTYQLTVRSGDKSGYAASSRPLVFTTLTREDRQKPSVALVLPDNLSGKHVAIKAEARDNTAVAAVVFFLNGQAMFTDFSAPYEWDYDTSELPEGSFSFGARACDAAGNVAEDIRSAGVQHHVAAALSPVKVRITIPERGSDVCGWVGIAAEISHERGLGISLVEFSVDGVVLRQQDFTPPRRVLPTTVSCPWSPDGLSLGEHIINVRARDTADNWGSAGIRVNVVARPDISLVREVQREGNYFRTTLTLSNTGGADAVNLTITDTSHGFQCVAGVSTRTSAESYWFRTTAGTVRNDADSYWHSTLEFPVVSLGRGESRSYRYYLAPVLVDAAEGTPMPVVGATTRITYSVGTVNYARTFHASWSDQAEIDAACLAADYLLVTCPTNLLARNPAADVGTLLSAMGNLAVYKNGVLGYISSATAAGGAAGLFHLIDEEGPWRQALTPGWLGSGYLLLVGEPEIVPTFNLPGAPLSDYNYTHITGDWRPEIRLGRIIGNTAAALTVPLVNSVYGEYWGSSALLVSGPEDTWEPNVLDVEMGKDKLEAKGVTVAVVHAEYWTTEYGMLAEALRVKKAPQGASAQKALAEFLLKQIGPPNGADAADDLSGYTASELAAWCLWARGMLAAGVTRDDAIDDADNVVRRAGRDLNGAMWGVMQNMLMRGVDDRLYTEKQLAAWILWEETTPRGPLSRLELLGTVTVDGAPRQVAEMTLAELIRYADEVVTAPRFELAKRRAEAIQAANASRGEPDSPWSYVYCPDNHATEAARSAAIKGEAAEGKDLVVFCGHGDPGGWGGTLTDWVGTGSEIDPLDCGPRNPVVVAFSCYTGFYQSPAQTDALGAVLNPNPSISEAFLRNGAAVYLGATVPMLYSTMDALARDKFWRYWSRREAIGDTLFELKTNVIGLGTAWRDFTLYYNLYGDPKYGQM